MSFHWPLDLSFSRWQNSCKGEEKEYVEQDSTLIWHVLSYNWLGHAFCILIIGVYIYIYFFDTTYLFTHIHKGFINVYGDIFWSLYGSLSSLYTGSVPSFPSSVWSYVKIKTRPWRYKLEVFHTVHVRIQYVLFYQLLH